MKTKGHKQKSQCRLRSSLSDEW